jgi:hypothetical protein
MSKMSMRNLTLASAKHLVTQGHISNAQHKRIVKKVAVGRMTPPAVNSQMMMDPQQPQQPPAMPPGAGMGMLGVPPEGV